MYIYITTNTINNKVYIGKSQKDFNKSYLGSGKLLKKAIAKYGIESFRVDLIEECLTDYELNERERYWISKYRETHDVYNIAEGGTGGWTTKFFSDEDMDNYREKLRIKRIGKKLSAESIASISMKNKGRFFGDRELISKKISEAWKNPNSTYNSLDYRIKLSECKRNRLFTEETKKKISDSKLGSKNAMSVKVMVDGIIYETINECSIEYGISSTAVSKRCKNKKFKNWIRL